MISMRNGKKILTFTLVMLLVLATITIVGQAGSIRNSNIEITEEKVEIEEEKPIITNEPTEDSKENTVVISETKDQEKQTTNVISSTESNEENEPEIRIPVIKIEAPSEILENEEFEIFVFSQKNNEQEAKPVPIANATVKVGWNDIFYYTDSEGLLDLIAPEVNDNVGFSIGASKEGYERGYTKIMVVDLPNLYINTSSSIAENTEFTVKVTAKGLPIDKVSVQPQWTNITYYTNINGTVQLTSPEVENDTYFFIKAFKQG